MRLRLQHPLTPDYASRHAQIAVDAARDVEGVELDYSPESLIKVDRIVAGFHDAGVRSSQVGATVFSFGCYVGEVLVRHQGGRWVLPKASLLSKLGLGGANMMLVELPNGGCLESHRQGV